jgi:hypothetical protein
VLVALSALVASVGGLVAPGVYDHVVDEPSMPFMIAQDAVSLAAALSLLVMHVLRGRGGARLDILQMGVVGYLFYAYGPYVMGTVYNPLYLSYMAVFGLSIFYLICALTGIDYGSLDFVMPNSLRYAIAAYCAAMPVLWAPQWVVAVLRNADATSRPGDFGLYWVYVLDLCFVLPVCALTAVLLVRRKALGYLLGGALSIKGFTLMLSIALGFLFQPLFGDDMVVAGGAVQFSAVSLVFLALSALYFRCTRVGVRVAGGAERREGTDVADTVAGRVLPGVR